MWNFFKKKKQIEIFAPVNGKLVNLDKVEDEVFSQKMLGDGFAFIPSDGNFVSPIDGKLITVYPTGHAYGIEHESGLSLLIHIGMDTVKLKGEGFNVKVEQDQMVKTGDILVESDLKFIKANAPSITTPLVFMTETMEGKTIEILKTGKVSKGDLIAVIK